jgi:hypothetical protein
VAGRFVEPCQRRGGVAELGLAAGALHLVLGLARQHLEHRLGGDPVAGRHQVIGQPPPALDVLRLEHEETPEELGPPARARRASRRR